MACTQPASGTQSAVFFAPRAPRAATSRGATSGDGRIAPTRCCGNRHPFLLFHPLACLLRLLCFLGHTQSPDLHKDYSRPARVQRQAEISVLNDFAAYFSFCAIVRCCLRFGSVLAAHLLSSASSPALEYASNSTTASWCALTCVWS